MCQNDKKKKKPSIPLHSVTNICAPNSSYVRNLHRRPQQVGQSTRAPAWRRAGCLARGSARSRRWAWHQAAWWSSTEHLRRAICPMRLHRWKKEKKESHVGAPVRRGGEKAVNFAVLYGVWLRRRRGNHGGRFVEAHRPGLGAFQEALPSHVLLPRPRLRRLPLLREGGLFRHGRALFALR